MRETNEYGYATKTVNGGELTIKDCQMGTRNSSVARRLLAYEDVCCVRVEYDGTVTVHVDSENTQSTRDIIPSDYTVERAMVHGGEGASAHIGIRQQ